MKSIVVGKECWGFSGPSTIRIWCS